MLSTGLDPAGPGFQGDSPVAQPLTESDASNVAVIVTDGMFYGMAVPNCTTVYLNGGGIRLQPMCKDLKSDIFRKKSLLAMFSRIFNALRISSLDDRNTDK